VVRGTGGVSAEDGEGVTAATGGLGLGLGRGGDLGRGGAAGAGEAGSRRPPIRAGRVLGRLPSTPGSEALDLRPFAPFPLTCRSLEAIVASAGARTKVGNRSVRPGFPVLDLAKRHA
jgi:hypothetical protein